MVAPRTFTMPGPTCEYNATSTSRSNGASSLKCAAQGRVITVLVKVARKLVQLNTLTQRTPEHHPEEERVVAAGHPPRIVGVVVPAQRGRWRYQTQGMESFNGHGAPF